MGDIIVILQTFITLLELIKDSNKLTTEQKEKAHLALSEAYHETEAYYAALEENGLKSKEREFRIAGLWEKASILVRPVNEELSYRLGVKSQFWREGAAWSARQIQEAKIGLEMVRSSGHKLLKKPWSA